MTNDIFTREDQEFLIRNEALSDPGRIRAIETGASRSRSVSPRRRQGRGLTLSRSQVDALMPPSGQ